MSQASPSPSLSEISHLFLTDVRQRQTRGAVRPVRIPPGGQRLASGSTAAPSVNRASIDLTPEEFATSLAASDELPADQDATDDDATDDGDEKEPADFADEDAEDRAGDGDVVVAIGGEKQCEEQTSGGAVVLPDAAQLAGGANATLADVNEPIPTEPPEPADGDVTSPTMEAPAAVNVIEAIESAVEADDRAEAAFSFAELPIRQVALVFANHLGSAAAASVLAYGRHLAEEEGQVAMLHVSGDAWRLVWFDASQDVQTTSSTQATAAATELRAQRLYEALQEMSWDSTRWLVWIENSSVSEAILAAAPQGVLLSTGDHEGIIGCYRALKGLTSQCHIPLSLAVVDCQEAAQSQRAWRKLSAVSEQFLNRTLSNEGAILQVAPVNVQTVWSGHPSEGEIDSDCWRVVERWLSLSQPPKPRVRMTAAAPGNSDTVVPLAAPLNVPSVGETMKIVETPAESLKTAAKPSAPPTMAINGNETQVLELDGDGSCTSILSAVTRQSAEWIECPLQPPMCPAARIAVSRDRRLTLLAVAGQGLRELKAIGQGYRWISENRDLIRMALPQFAIDTSAAPMLRLFVDHHDLSADALQSMIQSEHVTLQPYRRLRWGTRTGLMLEAA